MLKGKKFWLVVIILLLIVGSLIVYFNSDSKDSSGEITSVTDSNQAVETPGTATTEQSSKLIIGNLEAKLTIVEYGDFQCPFCKEFFEDTEPDILSNYIDTGKAKLEFRVETHIGKESVRAGEAAYCANDQTRFKQYHDQLYKRQKGYNAGTFSDQNLKRIASDIGLDQAAFDACLDSQKHLATVQASDAEAKQNGVTATPTIIIGERKVSGAQPYAIYKALIDAQL